MKTYKVILGGRGAEVYIHPINEDKKKLLTEMGVEEESVEINFDRLAEVLEVGSWDDTDEVYLGAYDDPTAYHITVLDEQENVVWQSPENYYLNDSDCQEDYQFIEKESSLMIENYLKGVFKEYILTIDEDFNADNLTPVISEINEEVIIMTDLKYNGEEMEIDDYGDNWSKGTFFKIF